MNKAKLGKRDSALTYGVVALVTHSKVKEEVSEPVRKKSWLPDKDVLGHPEN